jgi:DHA2 family multidrug resistance protein-like MFS transporter
MNNTDDGLPVPRRYWAILTLMIGVALSYLDTALVNVALPTIARDLNASPANSIWVVNAYQLAVMISLLPFAANILCASPVCGAGMGLFQQPNARSIVMSAPLARSGGAGAIQGTARLLGQSIGAALVALVFGLAGGHGAKTTIVLAAGFAAVGTLTSLSRMFDFVRAPLSSVPPARPVDRS